mmetsp:Transcript_18353/g.30165  ORF Transcript_18353/g.30165 Transcript_18353/m.30165 type:complete len:298 (+) Transcript_18353:167-1060(+)
MHAFATVFGANAFTSSRIQSLECRPPAFGADASTSSIIRSNVLERRKAVLLLSGRRTQFLRGEKRWSFSLERNTKRQNAQPSIFMPPSIFNMTGEEISSGDIVEYVSPYKAVGGKTQYGVGQVISVSKDGRVDIKPFDKISSYKGKALYKEDKTLSNIWDQKANVRIVDAEFDKAQDAWEVVFIEKEEDLPVAQEVKVSDGSFTSFAAVLDKLDTRTAIFAAVMSAFASFGMNKATIALQETFADNPINFENPNTVQVAETFRSLFEAASVGATGLFAMVSLGLLLLSIRRGPSNDL